MTSPRSGLAAAYPRPGSHVGGHWHASDAFGYAVLGLAVALTLWAARRK